MAKRVEIGILGVFILVTTVLFWDGSLDIEAAQLFFHPENSSDVWFEQNRSLWKFFYHAAPVITGLFLFPALWMILKATQLRKYGILIFLSVALGPGLVINSVFKPYWGRPRPRQVVELGGQKQHLSFIKPGDQGGGMSFPCGHSSVGYNLSVFYFVFKRRRPKMALASLGAAGILGTMMGLGRMAAGGHFLSDVLWSAFFPFLVNWWLYYYGLKIPQREDHPTQPVKIHWGWGLALSTVVVAVLLIATPYQMQTQDQYVFQGQSIVLETPTGEINVVESTQQQDLVEVQAQFQGFGFPGSRLVESKEISSDRLTLRFQKKGLFSDLEGKILLTVPAGIKLEVHSQKAQVTAPATVDILLRR